MRPNVFTQMMSSAKNKRNTRRSRPKGQMYERTAGVWLLCVSAGFDRGGKRRRYYRTVRGNWDEADAALSVFKKEIEDEAPHRKRTQTLADYLNRWLEYDLPNEVAPSTLRRYRADIKRFIIPSLGAIKLAELKSPDLKEAYSSWQRERRDGRKGTLSAQTVLHVHRVLHHALALAVDSGALPRNPATPVKLPKAIRREMKVLTDGQAGALLHAARGGEMELPITLGLGCGLRRNELLALRWRDISLDRRALTVAQSMDYDQETGFKFKPPKNDRVRRVALPQIVVEALRRHRARQNEKRLNRGSLYKAELDLVICGEDGSPIKPDAFASAFRQVVKKAGLPDCGPHTMRHSFATLGLAGGSDPLSLAQALGHHSAGFTLQQYGHVLSSMQIQTASVLDATLREAQNAASQDRPLDRTKPPESVVGDNSGDKSA